MNTLITGKTHFFSYAGMGVCLQETEQGLTPVGVSSSEPVENFLGDFYRHITTLNQRANNRVQKCKALLPLISYMLETGSSNSADYEDMNTLASLQRLMHEAMSHEKDAVSKTEILLMEIREFATEKGLTLNTEDASVMEKNFDAVQDILKQLSGRKN